MSELLNYPLLIFTGALVYFGYAYYKVHSQSQKTTRRTVRLDETFVNRDKLDRTNEVKIFMPCHLENDVNLINAKLNKCKDDGILNSLVCDFIDDLFMTFLMNKYKLSLNDNLSICDDKRIYVTIEYNKADTASVGCAIINRTVKIGEKKE